MADNLPQLLIVRNKELIFVLLHNLADKVAVVVQNDGQNGYSPHRRTFIPGQQFLHFLSVL
jgi:hypothetical protein